MKKQTLKRIISLLLILLLVFSLASCKKEDKPEEPAQEEPDQEEPAQEEAAEGEEEASEDAAQTEEESEAFSEFVDSVFLEALESSYLATHIYFLDPVASGVNLDNVEVSYGHASTPEKRREDEKRLNKHLETLYSFDRSTLSHRQQDEYDTIEWDIKSSLLLLDEKFDYYEQFFAPPNGLDSSIASWLTHWELRNEREVQEIITLLKDLPDTVNSYIEYAKIQQEKELLMTNFDDIIEGCNDTLELGTDSIILTDFLKEVDKLTELDDAKKQEYKDEITAAFTECYLPSFSAIIEAMNSMKDGYNNTEGLAKFPNGKEYFEILVNQNSGTWEESAEDLYDYLDSRGQSIMTEVYKVYTSDPDSVTEYYDGAFTTSYSSYDEVLKDVEQKLLADFPEVKGLDYTIENADPEEKLDEKNVAAYFLIPPLDGDHDQRMRVNPSNTEMDSLDTYTTVTHEGFPGHMYQYAYTYDNIDSYYINSMGIDSIVEGYAVYAQYSALNYLDDEIPDSVKKIHVLDNRAAYVIYSMADIGINYMGWSVKETKDFFAEQGYTLDMEQVLDIFDFLRCSPCAYLPYGYGYELIADMQDAAKTRLGAKFDIKSFNTALLNAGPTIHSVVRRHVDEYIAKSI